MTTGVCLKRIVSSINSGTAIDKEKIENNALYPVYGGGNKVGFCNEYNCGDAILIGRVGSCGHITLVKEKCWATDNALIIKTKYNLSYIAYILRCADFSPLISQTAMPLLTGGKLKELVVPFVFDEYRQAQIVHFLDHKCSAIDTAIEKTKKSIEKLEEYKKAVITKAVTKGIDPNAKMKDSGVEWIGEIPEGWEVKPLRQFYSRRLNKNKDMSENNLLSLSYGKIIRKNIETKEGLLPESFDGYNIVEPGDIVIRGTDLQNDHRSLRTGLVTERGIITSAYMTLKPNVHVNSEYYHYLLHCYDLAKVFYSMGGGLRQGLDYWEFIRLFVLVPSQKKQCEIVNYIKDKCSAIDTAMEKKKKAIEEWEEYKKSLIYYAVTGKIDCRNEVVK